MSERVELDGEAERVVKAVAAERGTDESTVARAALRRAAAKSHDPDGKDDSEELDPEPE